METIKIFYCYAREDEALRYQLENQLETLRRLGEIAPWHDRNISAGTDWRREIDAHLNTSDIILLLITPNFVRSDYCYSIEMQQALKRHEKGEASIVPVILRPVDWSELPIGYLQALPTDGRPVTTWRNRDEAFANIGKGIRQVIAVIRSRKIKQQRINEGDVYYQAQQYKEALIVYEQALELDPTDAFVQCQKGRILFGLGSYNEALAAFEQATRLRPDNSAAYCDKGTVLQTLGRYEEAMDAYAKAKVENYYGMLIGISEGSALWNLLNTIYNVLLERTVDSVGFRVYSGVLFRHRASVREVIRHIGHSEEYKDRFIRNLPVEDAVKLCYKHFLCRDADSGGLQHYINIANTHSFDVVIDSLIDSLEYMQKFGDNLPLIQEVPNQVREQ